MILRYTALCVLGGAALFAARPVPLCVDNQAAMDRWTVDAMKREVIAILAESGMAAHFVPCAEGIRITIRGVAPPASEGALGAARQQGAVILPDITVYVQPVRRLIDSTLPALLGKAAARVAVHELGHYFRQSPHHDAEGVMTAYFAGPRLIAARSSEFRLR